MRLLLENWIKKTGDMGQLAEEKIWLPEKKNQ
jgi:hypothetical protein